MKKIKTLKELKKLTHDKQLDCFICLAGGLMRSSKNIFYFPETKKYEVMHEIDGTVEMLTEKEMLEDTNIGEALEKGALFAY